MGDTEKYYYNNPSLPLFTFELFYGSWWAGSVSPVYVYPFGKDGNPHMRDRRNEIGCSFPLSSTQRLSRMSRGNPAKKQSPIDPCIQCVYGCSFCQDAHWRKEPSHLIAPSFFLHDRTPVCVCDLLFDTKPVPFSILYPKLSIPYYIKERTPIDIVFLSAWWQVHYIYTQRHTCNCHLFQLLFIFFYFRFPGGKIKH